MNSKNFRIWPLAVSVALMPSARCALGQMPAGVEEPRWLKLRLSEISTGVYAEGNYEETRFKNSDTSVSYDRIFVGPSVGMVLDGSVYHPNLVRLHMNSEGAYGWARSSSNSRSEEQFEYLGRFNGSADLFSNQPLRATVFGDYDHSYRDYDFFSRLIVDTWRYGGRMSYSDGPWHVLTSYTHRQEETQGRSFYYTNVVPVIVGGVDTGTTREEARYEDGISTLEDDTISADIRHERLRGGTTANYTFNRYTRQDVGSLGSGNDHSLSLGNNQTFGNRNQHTLLTSASYIHRENDFDPSDDYGARANLNLEHRPNLDSIYDFTFDRYQAGDYVSDNYNVQGQLRHQLYESLTSTLILQGADNEVSDVGAEGSTRRLGGGFSEAYTKRLGPSHRLRVSNNLMAEHIDTQWQGQVINIANESHSFGAAGPADSFYLNQPLVKQSTIKVFNASRTQEYVRNVHYRVWREGASTRIERTGVVPMDNTVVVDYEAEPTPSGAYETLNDTFTARVDLWNNLWGIYGRVSSLTSNAREEMRVQSIFSYAVGTDVNWRWMRAGAEYEYYDSTFASYQSTRLFQGVTFDIDYTSVFSFDFTETWTKYLNSGRSEQTYSAIGRYRNQLTSSLSFSVEGGISLRRGEGVEQDLATARPALEYAVGKTTLRAEYNFEHELYLKNEERTRHMFLLRWRRLF